MKYLAPRSRIRPWIIAAFQLGVVAATITQPADEVLTIPLPGSPPKLDGAFGRQPLAFEHNAGQVDDEVQFLARGPGYQLFLTETEAVMVLLDSPDHGRVPLALAEGRTPRGPDQKQDQLPDTASCNSALRDESFGKSTTMSAPHVLRMRLVGANVSALVRGDSELQGKVNYFIGNDPALWRTNVPTFRLVRSTEVYPGIDLVYYGNEGQLEYDFIVAPGADPDLIALNFEGADRIELDTHGDLIAWVTGRPVRWKRPVVYQEFDGERHEVAGNYRLDHDSLSYQADAQIGFELASYDRSQPLVIDPVLVYSTYLGGNSYELSYGIAVDADANVYITGYTGSADFPIRSALYPTRSVFTDTFVAKFNPSGELLYSTYLGGSGFDEGYGVALDASGNCYVAGYTSSPNFPVVNPIQSVHGGSDDVFIAALKPDGSALLFSTYLGGSRHDSLEGGIALDPSGNIYVAGFTQSPNFPTLNAFQSRKGDLYGDGFITKLEAGGKRLLYSTYFGGSGNDILYSWALDLEGNAFISGSTGSDDLPIKNAAQPWLLGDIDSFYAKIHPDGSDLFYCSYFGGYESVFEGFGRIAVGANGTFVLAASTTSDGLSTVAPPASTLSDSSDTIVAQFNAADGTLIASTYLGGNNSDQAASVAMDSAGDIYVLGGTASSDFPTVQPLQSDYRGYDYSGNEVFLTKLRGDDLSIAFSTYFGGTGDDIAGSVALDGQGNVFITGGTSSTNEFLLVNSFQASFGGGSYDAFVAKISMSEVLKMSRSGQSLAFSWPAAATGFQMESTGALGAEEAWENVATAPVVIGDQQVVTVDIGPGSQFFRLRKP